MTKRPGLTTVAVTVAIVLIAGSTAFTGYALWQHRQATQERQRSAEFAAAARQGVVTLLSLNFNNAQADVQRLIDNTTDGFRSDLESGRDDFVAVVQDSKVVATGSVDATAVESVSSESAVVLVAATSGISNTADAKGDSRKWRLAVSISSDSGQLKMSKVEYVS